MSTEVKHGPSPTFDLEVTPGAFFCRVVGRYTSTPGWGAGGVTAFAYESTKPVKRMAELLVLRTAFLEWFREQYEANGGSRFDAAEQVHYIADSWVQGVGEPERDPRWTR